MDTQEVMDEKAKENVEPAMEETTEENDPKSKFGHTKMSLSIRVVIGAYLVYTAYGLIQSSFKYEGKQFAAYFIAGIFFGLFGLVCTIHAIVTYQKGAYVGGKMDVEYLAALEAQAGAEQMQGASESDAHEENGCEPECGENIPEDTNS